MPVLVTAPGSETGREIIRRLAATGGEVRAFGPELPVAEFRALGAICASGSLLDEGHLETAMEQVHTVVHLPVGPQSPSAERALEETATVVAAAIGARVRRFVTLSMPGAREAAPESLRRAAGEIESLVASAPFPATSVRTSLVDTVALREQLARTPLSREALDNPVAPVRASDLAAVIAWLDDRRSGTLPDFEVLAADGPEVVSLGDYLRSAGVTPMSVVGRVVERLRSSASVLSAAMEGPWTSGPGITSAWQRTGIEPSPPDWD